MASSLSGLGRLPVAGDLSAGLRASDSLLDNDCRYPLVVGDGLGLPGAARSSYGRGHKNEGHCLVDGGVDSNCPGGAGDSKYDRGGGLVMC